MLQFNQKIIETSLQMVLAAQSCLCTSDRSYRQVERPRQELPAQPSKSSFTLLQEIKVCVYVNEAGAGARWWLASALHLLLVVLVVHGVASHHMHTAQQHSHKSGWPHWKMHNKSSNRPALALTHTNLGALHFPSAQTGMCVQAGT
jgi:hypothetical protein